MTGQALALADKMDSLVGCFAVGLVPSGSSDPFALRRAAMGIVKILMETKLPVSLSLTDRAFGANVGEFAAEDCSFPRSGKTGAGFHSGPRAIRSEGARRAGLRRNQCRLAAGSDDLVDAVRRIEAIKAIRKTKNFEPLAVSFKRIRKILGKGGPEAGWKLPAVRPDLFAEDAERQLHARAAAVANEAEQYKREGRYREALQDIAGLRPDVDRFFDDVMVMAEDEQVRKNRLTLLSGCWRNFRRLRIFRKSQPRRREVNINYRFKCLYCRLADMEPIRNSLVRRGQLP